MLDCLKKSHTYSNRTYLFSISCFIKNTSEVKNNTSVSECCDEMSLLACSVAAACYLVSIAISLWPVINYRCQFQSNNVKLLPVGCCSLLIKILYFNILMIVCRFKRQYLMLSSSALLDLSAHRMNNCRFKRQNLNRSSSALLDLGARRMNNCRFKRQNLMLSLVQSIINSPKQTVF